MPCAFLSQSTWVYARSEGTEGTQPESQEGASEGGAEYPSLEVEAGSEDVGVPEHVPPTPEKGREGKRHKSDVSDWLSGRSWHRSFLCF